MTDQVLDILKLALLGLLYLFFARVLWAVWSEVRPAETRSSGGASPKPAEGPGGMLAGAGSALGVSLPHKSGPPTKLVILEPKKRRGASFPIDGVIGIGRESDNTLMIAGDAFVSTYHARVWVADGNVMIADRGSKNGTFLNGSRIVEQRPLHAGDRIQIGYTTLEARA